MPREDNNYESNYPAHVILFHHGRTFTNRGYTTSIQGEEIMNELRFTVRILDTAVEAVEHLERVDDTVMASRIKTLLVRELMSHVEFDRNDIHVIETPVKKEK